MSHKIIVSDFSSTFVFYAAVISLICMGDKTIIMGMSRFLAYDICFHLPLFLSGRCMRNGIK